MPLPFDPNWKPESPERGPAGTDLQSLMSVPDVFQPQALAPEATDFHSLKAQTMPATRAVVPRTVTDHLIDALIPLHLLVMVYAVVFFLLDVRYVYTSELDQSMRIVAGSFILGLVALNRVIARDGTSESVLYILGLAGAIGLYTFSTTGLYDAGSVARNFMNSNAYLATAFNMAVVAFLWWLVNRLMHECCVDENRSAGDIGILTGTARNLRKVLARTEAQAADAKPAAPEPQRAGALGGVVPMMQLDAIDPTEFRKPVSAAPAPLRLRASDRLATRHPGISILLFAVPVLGIFALGLRVIQHGGEAWILRGMQYMGLYVFCSLMLLLFTSLSGLREYFRARRVAMPPLIGAFWVGLGLVMVITVMIGALNLPMPSLPPIAQIDEHVRDEYDRGDRFVVKEVSLTPVEALRQEAFIHRLSQGVLVVLGALALYGALKAVAWAAWRALQRRRSLPGWLVALLRVLEHFFSSITRLPKLPARPAGRVRVARGVALSADFRNSMGDPVLSRRLDTRGHIEHAYTALCALATDLGVPRRDGETPLEFIQRFPPALAGLREEAEALTRLYVVSAYSDLPVEERILDQVRKFWITFDRIRNRVVR